jgi:hypothetical protein
VVETELEELWLSSLGGLASVLLGLSSLLQSLGLLLSGLRGIFSEELEERGGFVLVASLGELVDGGGHLQSLEQDSLLSLDSDVLWPLNESSKVALWLDISSKTEVAWILLEKRSGTTRAGGCTSFGFNNLSSLLCFLHLNSTTKAIE